MGSNYYKDTLGITHLLLLFTPHKARRYNFVTEESCVAAHNLYVFSLEGKRITPKMITSVNHNVIMTLVAVNPISVGRGEDYHSFCQYVLKLFRGMFHQVASDTALFCNGAQKNPAEESAGSKY